MARAGAQLVGALALGACAKYYPPVAVAPRAAWKVAAPFEKTWNAVIDVFAEQNTPIQTIDRSSGLLVAERAVIPLQTTAQQQYALLLADCGLLRNGGNTVHYWPTTATYNVVVRSSADGSTVKVTAKFLSVSASNRFECVSHGRYETETEIAIQSRAEKP